MCRNICTLLIAIAGLVSSLHAVATDFFVAVGGTSTVCSQTDPCGKIQTAIDRAQSSDVIHVTAGVYYENITIASGKTGLTILGANNFATVIESAGGNQPLKFAPAGVAADIVIDVFSSNVRLRNLVVRHPPGLASKRDIGIFIRPPAYNVAINECMIERLRAGPVLEPTTPGSRGVLVLRAATAVMVTNILRGNYQDHIHIPAPKSVIMGNRIVGATRAGIAIIQENDSSDSNGHYLEKNYIEASGIDGIHVQSDSNTINFNTIKRSGNAGIKLCGAGDCFAPGSNANAANNVLRGNLIINSGVADIIDNGDGNLIKTE